MTRGAKNITTTTPIFAEELKKLKPVDRRYAFTSQTTAEVADLERITANAREIFPGIQIFNTICNATGHRQAAVLDLAPEIELMLVVGSASSANSNRLCDISKAICGNAYLINSVDSLEKSWLDEVTAVGLTAGASTPDFLVEEVIARLVEYSDGVAKVFRPDKNGKKAWLAYGQHGS